MSRDNLLLKSLLFVTLFTFVLFGIDFYNKNTELVFSVVGNDTLFKSNALTLDEFREKQGWGIENLQLLEDQSGIEFTIANDDKDIYSPNRYWYTSISIKSYSMKLSLRAKIDDEPLTLLPHTTGIYSVPMGNDRIGTGIRQALTKFRVDGNDYYWVILYNVDSKQKISDLESRILTRPN